MKRAWHRIVSITLVIVLAFALCSEAFAITYCESRATYGYLTVTTPSGLNARKAPRTWVSRIVGVIPGGVTVHVKNYSGNWAQIDTGTYDGCWICTDYTATTRWDGRSWGKISTRSRCGVNLRRGPSTAFSCNTVIPYNATVSVLYSTGSWLYVTYNVGRRTYDGWVSRSYVQLYGVTSR